MPKFLFCYHGGHFLPEHTETVDAAWKAWMDGVGDRAIDRGGPLKSTKTIMTGSVSGIDTGPSEVTGYSIILADSLDQALEIASRCPQTASPHRDGSVEVAELME